MPKGERLTQEDRRRGGMNSHAAAREITEPVTLRSAADILRVVEHETNIARAMARGVQRGRLVGFLAKVALSALATAELEARVAALERQLSEANRSRAA